MARDKEFAWSTLLELDTQTQTYGMETSIENNDSGILLFMCTSYILIFSIHVRTSEHLIVRSDPEAKGGRADQGP